MVLFVSVLTALTYSTFVLHTGAAPLHRRQVGDLQCNIARLKTVSGLSATQKAVDQIASAAGSDTTTSQAASDAQSGLQTAQGGIATIAQALLTGQDAPADARSQVGDGLTTAKTALDSITSTDPAVTSSLQTAQSKLSDTISAGQDVVADCGGGSGSAADTGTDTSSTGTGISGANLASVSDAGVETGTAIATADDSTITPLNEVGNDTEAATVTVTVTVTAAGTAPTAATPGPPALTNKAGEKKPNRKRQVGNLQCNLARGQAVSSLSSATQNVNSILSASAGDAATNSAASDAQSALSSAQDGISQIAQALLAGQNAPPEGREQVDQGLTDAQTALGGITSTDPAVTSAVTKAQTAIKNGLAASQQVAANCTPN